MLVFGLNELGNLRIMASTFKDGDPSFAGVLGGVALGLKSYHIFELKDEIPAEVWAREMAFNERIGMPGFAPTQGHIPSGVPCMGHAIAAMRSGALARVMFVCKASLFLNRLTELYDGVSFILEAQPGARPESDI